MARHFVLDFCPICGKSITEARILDLLLPMDRWTIHCHSGAYCHITGTDGVERVIYLAKAAEKAAE